MIFKQVDYTHIVGAWGVGARPRGDVSRHPLTRALRDDVASARRREPHRVDAGVSRQRETTRVNVAAGGVATPFETTRQARANADKLKTTLRRVD